MQATGRQLQWAPDGATLHFEHHWRDQTTPWHLVLQHAATSFEQALAESGTDLPRLVKDGVDALRKCGVLAHGFLRLRCGDCSHNKPGAFSGRRRGWG